MRADLAGEAVAEAIDYRTASWRPSGPISANSWGNAPAAVDADTVKPRCAIGRSTTSAGDSR